MFSPFSSPIEDSLRSDSLGGTDSPRLVCKKFGFKHVGSKWFSSLLLSSYTCGSGNFVRLRNRRCFRCGEKGHIKTFCINAMRCYFCGFYGHSKRICHKWARFCTLVKHKDQRNYLVDDVAKCAFKRLHIYPCFDDGFGGGLNDVGNMVLGGLGGRPDSLVGLEHDIDISYDSSKDQQSCFGF